MGKEKLKVENGKLKDESGKLNGEKVKKMRRKAKRREGAKRLTKTLSLCCRVSDIRI